MIVECLIVAVSLIVANFVQGVSQVKEKIVSILSVI